MEAKLQESLKIYRVQLNEPTIHEKELVPHVGGVPTYETKGMFQGTEEVDGILHNRRIYKSALEIPFISIEDGTRVLKIYSLSKNKEEIKQEMLDYMTSYYNSCNDNRITASIEEEQTIETIERW